ncbi:integrase family protein [Paraburkholderia bryophila]|uniref:tyrosine-type recombinase/integrase n=1 Tax=Paraburkholderia bryophila TaxID=420952 RepID=UPI0038BDA0AD
MEESTKNRFAFSEKSIESLSFAPSGEQKMYYDTNSKLALRVGAKKKTFCVNQRLPGRGAPVRVSLGEFGDIPVTDARKKAAIAIGEIANGVNKHEVKKEQKLKAIIVEANKTETLKWLFDEYEQKWLIDRKGGKKATLKSHEDAKKFFVQRSVTLLKKDKETGIWSLDKIITLSDWMNRPWRSIARKEVLERFEYFARAKKSRGDDMEPMIRTHQIGFKGLHSAFNYVLRRTEPEDKVGLINPAQILTDYNLWEKTNVVERFIDFSKPEGARWWEAVIAYRPRNLVAAHYLLFSLLQTGRSIDVCDLTWNDVDFGEREITYERTKNGENYILYITDIALEILKELKQISKNRYVFYYPESKNGFIPQAAKQHFKNVNERGGKLISHHDLRRTWATASVGLVDKLTSDYCLKHKLAGVDANYYKNNRDVVRACMQRVEDHLLKQVAAFPSNAPVAEEVA